MDTEICPKCEANTWNLFDAWRKWLCNGEKPEELAVFNMYQKRINDCTESHTPHGH